MLCQPAPSRADLKHFIDKRVDTQMISSEPAGDNTPMPSSVKVKTLGAILQALHLPGDCVRENLGAPQRQQVDHASML